METTTVFNHFENENEVLNLITNLVGSQNTFTIKYKHSYEQCSEDIITTNKFLVEPSVNGICVTFLPTTPPDYNKETGEHIYKHTKYNVGLYLKNVISITV